MTIYTEQDIVNHYIDNTHFDENIKLHDNNLEVFFKGDNKDVPIEYYYIFRELALVRNLYKNSINGVVDIIIVILLLFLLV